MKQNKWKWMGFLSAALLGTQCAVLPVSAMELPIVDTMPEHAKDIILALTGNKDNLLKISKDYSDFTNTKSGMQAVATDDTFASDFLGGQNPFTYFAPVAENIKIAPLSAYDQGCVELIQNAFSDYFQGQVDYDKAKSNFETAIKERYPEIQEVNWAE